MRKLLLGTLMIACGSLMAAAETVKGIIGHDLLLLHYGSQPIDGEGVRVAQVDAPENDDDRYIPNPDDFVGKAFNVVPFSVDPPLVSGHATFVGQNFYGSSSIAPGITDIDVYQAVGWLTKDFLMSGTSSLPRSNAPTTPSAPPARVTTHTWVTLGPVGGDADIEMLERTDYMIDRDNSIQVAGVRNDVGLQNFLLSSAYNVISVGLLNGRHGNGVASFGYPGGRQAPHIVAPAGSTSGATPIVGAAAALLVQHAHNRPDLSHHEMDGDVYFGETAVVIKAALMAGARRDLIRDNGDANTIFNSTRNGSPTTYQPSAALGNLDPLFGAGLLNIYRSYQIIDAGQQNAFEDGGPSLVQAVGWDFNDHFGGAADEAVATYTFVIESHGQFTATLAWNAQIDGDELLAGNFVDALTLRNLDLRLFEAGSMTLIQESVTTDQNTENLYIPDLGPGMYVMQVSAVGGDFDIEYGLAWYTVPEPAGAMVLLLGATLLARRRG